MSGPGQAGERDPDARDGADRIELGKVVGVFGFRGELRVFLLNPDSDTLHVPRRVCLTLPDGAERTGLLSVRRGAGKRIIGRIDGVTSEDTARALDGAVIHIARADLPAPEDGEYYVHDLLGLAVVGPQGQPLGTLADVLSGDRDVWVIDTPSGEELVVASADNVLSVDLAGGRIVLAEGALSGP